MEIKVFVNSVFSSNTYLLFKEDSEYVWLIDPGSSIDLIGEWLKEKDKIVRGVLLTHTHFDHILGLNTLVRNNPQIEVFASAYAIQGLKSEKLNGSLYMEIPFVVEDVDVIIVKQDDILELWEDINATVFETPGHDRDCISYHIADYLFSGDALIPGTKIYTKLKYSDKDKAKKTIDKIISHFNSETYVYAGHGEKCKLGKINIKELF